MVEKNTSSDLNINSARGAPAYQNSVSKTSFYSDFENNNSKISAERISAIQESFFEIAIQDPVINNNQGNNEDEDNIANSSLLVDPTTKAPRFNMKFFNCQESKSLLFWKIFCFWIMIPFFIIYFIIVYAYNLISIGCSCFANSAAGRSIVNCLTPFVNCSKIIVRMLFSYLQRMIIFLAGLLKNILDIILLPIKRICRPFMNGCYKVCCI